MDHHGGVDAVESAFARDHLFSAEALFRGRTEIANAAGKSCSQFGESEDGTQSGRRDDVMPASVTHAGQSVVF
jgi:hypothetical protein